MSNTIHCIQQQLTIKKKMLILNPLKRTPGQLYAMGLTGTSASLALMTRDEILPWSRGKSEAVISKILLVRISQQSVRGSEGASGGVGRRRRKGGTSPPPPLFSPRHPSVYSISSFSFISFFFMYIVSPVSYISSLSLIAVFLLYFFFLPYFLFLPYFFFSLPSFNISHFLHSL